MTGSCAVKLAAHPARRLGSALTSSAKARTAMLRESVGAGGTSTPPDLRIEGLEVGIPAAGPARRFE